MTHRITRSDAVAPQLPVTLDELKSHLKIETDAEDDLLAAYLETGVEWAEEFTHRAISKRNYLVVDDRFPLSGNAWKLPLGKVQSIASVQYIDSAGATQTWTASNYTLDNDSDSCARLRPVPTQDWPDIGEYDGAARVTMQAGWNAADVPYTVRQAILLYCGMIAEHRAPGDPEAEPTERAAERLLQRWELPIWA